MQMPQVRASQGAPTHAGTQDRNTTDDLMTGDERQSGRSRTIAYMGLLLTFNGGRRANKALTSPRESAEPPKARTVLTGH
jgi:hypothetical protein